MIINKKRFSWMIINRERFSWMITDEESFSQIITNNQRFRQIKIVRTKNYPRRSIGVHVSSVGKWGHQDHFKPVYFAFFTKRFHAHKNPHKQKQTNKTKISKNKKQKKLTKRKYKRGKNNTGRCFLRAQKLLGDKNCLFAFGAFALLCFLCFLCVWKLFVKKK